MASVTVPPTLRDRLITEFRRFLCTQIDFIPFEHQADWWVTTDGYTLTDHVVDPDTTTDPYITLRLPNSAIESRRLASRPLRPGAGNAPSLSKAKRLTPISTAKPINCRGSNASRPLPRTCASGKAMPCFPQPLTVPGLGCSTTTAMGMWTFPTGSASAASRPR